MNERKNTVLVEIGEIENSCFVVMPFDSSLQAQYEQVIRPAVEVLGLKCVRGDEIHSKPLVIADVWDSIRKSRLVIAELTYKNANVFYEVGLAHAIGKPIILLTRNKDDVTFDLQSHRYTFYNVDDPDWAKKLRGEIKLMVQRILDQPEIPVYLEGIKADIKFPRSPLLPKGSATTINVSGRWKLDMKGKRIAHQGAISITQHGEELSATLTLTSEKAGVTTVVQEEFLGTIQGKKVILNGTYYTYVQRGNAEKDYYLDNFHLLLSPDGQRMTGQNSSLVNSGKLTLVKQKRVS